MENAYRYRFGWKFFQRLQRSNNRPSRDHVDLDDLIEEKLYWDSILGDGEDNEE